MSLLESRARRSHRPPPTRDPATLHPVSSGTTQAPGARRIRQQAMESVAAASLSLGASVGATVAIWALLRWLS